MRHPGVLYHVKIFLCDVFCLIEYKLNEHDVLNEEQKINKLMVKPLLRLLKTLFIKRFC